MAEVVEMNIVCSDPLKNDILLAFIHKNVDNGGYTIESIEAMDNWKYDNSVAIDSKEISDYLSSNKIICITEKNGDGFAGIDIERIENKINYTFWVNQKKYNIASNYYSLINDFLLFIKQEIKSDFLMCAIGKEVIFEYQNNYASLFKKSHNIDVWINLDIESTDEVMEKYEKVTM